MTTDIADHSSWPISDAGIWLDLRMAPLRVARPALFLDRDGVIVSDTGFLSDPEAVELIPPVASLIKQANDAQIPVLVVTNQSGIDRGLLGWREFNAVEARIAALLSIEGAVTDATAACPFHPDHTPGYGEKQNRWRKPGPGMIEVFGDALNIDLPGSCLIGDRLRDLEAAREAGLTGGFLLFGAEDSDASAYKNSLETAQFNVDCGSTIAHAEAWLHKSGLFGAS